MMKGTQFDIGITRTLDCGLTYNNREKVTKGTQFDLGITLFLAKGDSCMIS